MDKMTTADFRRLAQECEDRLDFEGAAAYWRLALSRYPEGGGELAAKDRDNIRRRWADCLYFAEVFQWINS